jgi:predicted GIY-YIG superfamily endonuclease
MTPGYRVYVLQNFAERFYIGVTEDVARRLAQHNAGDSRWTRGKGRWRLVWESESLPLALPANSRIVSNGKAAARGFIQSPA